MGINPKITATGSYVPTNTIGIEDFYEYDFFETYGKRVSKNGKRMSGKECAISFLKTGVGILERKKADEETTASDLGFFAVSDLLATNYVNTDDIGCVVFAHNFGDITKLNEKIDITPSRGSKLGKYLKTKNPDIPDIIAQDIIFGKHNTEQQMVRAKELLEITDNDLIVKSARNDIDYIYEQGEKELSSIVQKEMKKVIVTHGPDEMPCLSERVVERLGLPKEKILMYDLAFGCPGFLEGLNQVSCMIRSRKIKKALVIGAETLSKVSDPHDRDSMIYADGGGAMIMEGIESNNKKGVISYYVKSDVDKADYFSMGPSYNYHYERSYEKFLKMKGRRVFSYAISEVHKAIKESIELANSIMGFTGKDKLEYNGLKKIKKTFVHQANERIDKTVLKNLFKEYGIKVSSRLANIIMPMITSRYGNSSVATIPIMVDRALKGKLDNHHIKEGDYVIFASVGAGMNTNSMVYKN